MGVACVACLLPALVRRLHWCVAWAPCTLPRSSRGSGPPFSNTGSPWQGEGAGLPGFILPSLRVGERKPLSFVSVRPYSLCRADLLSLSGSSRPGESNLGPPKRRWDTKRRADTAGPALGRAAPFTGAKSKPGGRGQGTGKTDTDKPAFLYFPQLSNFETVATLLDAVIPYFETNSAGTAKLTGRNAAHVMNKLKAMRRPQARSEAGPVANAERKRVEGALVRLMHIVSAKMDELALKHLALVLNAVKGSRGSAEAELVKTACSHAVKLLEQETQHTQDGQPPSVTAQPVAMLLNSLAMGAGGFSATAGASKTAADARPTHPQALGNADVVEPVFEASTRVLLAMPQDFFDAQSISTIMNAYASAGRWNLALFRRLGTMAVALAPERWTLQPVAMVVNAYSRLMEQVFALYYHFQPSSMC